MIRAIPAPLMFAARFLSGFFSGAVLIAMIHRLAFYHTLLPDPNRTLVWHDWAALAIELALGVSLGIALVREGDGVSAAHTKE